MYICTTYHFNTVGLLNNNGNYSLGNYWLLDCLSPLGTHKGLRRTK